MTNIHEFLCIKQINMIISSLRNRSLTRFFVIIPEFYSKFIKYRVEKQIFLFKTIENVARFLIILMITLRFIKIIFGIAKWCLCVIWKTF